MNEIMEKEIDIEDMIYEANGVEVMLDSDLARLFEYETKNLNRQVQRNIERFPENYCFQLTEEEYTNLRCQNVTSSSKNNYGGRRYLPYVFTEHGITMLSSILKSNIAIKMSLKIINTFIKMKKYIGTNEYRLSNVETKILEHDKNIKLLQESFDKLSEKKIENEIFFNGQIYDAYSKILNIFKAAKKELTIIDAYADNTILDIIKRINIKVTIITKPNNLLTNQDIKKYNKQYRNLKVIFNDTFHDRYFIIDKKELFFCGASINRIGYKTFGIVKMNDEETYKPLLNRISKIINNKKIE